MHISISSLPHILQHLLHLLPSQALGDFGVPKRSDCSDSPLQSELTSIASAESSLIFITSGVTFGVCCINRSCSEGFSSSSRCSKYSCNVRGSERLRCFTISEDSYRMLKNTYKQAQKTRRRTTEEHESGNCRIITTIIHHFFNKTRRKEKNCNFTQTDVIFVANRWHVSYAKYIKGYSLLQPFSFAILMSFCNLINSFSIHCSKSLQTIRRHKF